MVEVKYFKDYNHNYAILKWEDAEEAGSTYQTRMLASNKIDRLLKCCVRNVNGTAYLYYDISSKATLKNLYQVKKMTYEQVRDLFCQMDMIYRNLGQFLIDAEGLLMQPEYLYYDLTDRKYFGLYYPGKKKHSERPYEPLMDFLLNHIDNDDQKLVDLVYRIYEMSEESYFSIADVLTLFDGVEETSDKAREWADDEKASLEEKVTQDPQTSQWRDDETMDMSYASEDDKEEDYELPQKGRMRWSRSRIYYSIFAALSLCGICAVIGIYIYFQLTRQEVMIIVCCGAVMGLCLLFSVFQFLRTGREINRQETEDEKRRWEIEDEFRDERPIALEEIVDRGTGKLTMEAHPNSDRFERYGETVFVDMGKVESEYKLYALDKKNKKHIELTQFPYTIGKMAGCVDCVLSDDSVSRLHARFEKLDGRIYLTDMNSKNGTYKNGLRMGPSETVEIEPGDEIRFGRLNYCYR